MFLKLLEMKFKAFILTAVSFCCLMVLIYIKSSLSWLLGWQPPEPLHLTETLEETLARELAQVGSGWSGPVAYPGTPVMLWWTPFTGDDGLQQCGDRTCYFTNDREYRHHPMLKTVLFYGSDFKPHDLPLPRHPGVDWALFHEESPKNNPIFCHAAMMERFNHTATFRRASDMPLTTQYLEDIQMITDETFLIPVEVKDQLMVEEGLAPVAYVQSGCDTPSMRDEWVAELMRHVRVDSYGACLHNKDLPRELRGSEKMREREYLGLLAKYKFVISIENAVCDDYVTEKLWRTLQVGAVPIYLGAPNIEEYLPHPRAAVLVKDFGSVKEVAELVMQLDKDQARYESYLVHKRVHGGAVANRLLVELLEERRWGVTAEQQARLGNFVKHFQCLVCERVANNVHFTSLGFRALPYDASEDHYGCPVPTSPFTGQADKSNWWVEQWHRGLHEAETLETLLSHNQPFNSSVFRQSVLQHTRSKS